MAVLVTATLTVTQWRSYSKHRGALVKEKPQSLESVNDIAALDDRDRELIESAGDGRWGFVVHPSWQGRGRESHCCLEKRDPSRVGRKHFTLNNPKIHKSQ